MTIANTTDGRLHRGTRAADALKRLTEELNGLAEAELITINIDVVGVVTTSLGVLPNLVKLKDSIQKLPDYDTSKATNLETYAFAAYEAHAKYVSATRPLESLPALQQRGTLLRDRLFADVQSLVLRDIVKEEEIRQVKSENGYRALALDLTVLADALQTRWEAVQGKSATQLDELLEAEQLAEELLIAVGEKQIAPAVIADASALRSRAFTLLVRAYEEVRRGVLFLRWYEGDADAIAPSLYRGRGVSRSKDQPGEEEAGAEGATPSATPTNGESKPTNLPVDSSANVPIGLPGSNPYLAS